MKTKSMILVNLLFFSLVSFASSTETFTIQDINTIEGVFDGHEAYGYNFIIANTDDGSEHTMTFQNIKEELLNQFDLKSLVSGKKFKTGQHIL